MDQPILDKQQEFKDLDITINWFMPYAIDVKFNDDMIDDRKNPRKY